jgi:RNA polymerase sigma factor (sigma-70 family)
VTVSSDPTDLVIAAGTGDEGAWAALVDRYAGLVWHIALGYRLSAADAADVSQAVWLRAVEHLRDVRSPEHFGSWLATVARRESLHVLRARGREVPNDLAALLADLADPVAAPAEEPVLAAELRDLVRAAYATLPAPCQRLLSLLLRDPPMPYSEVSTVAGIPMGSIGPTRQRCLQRLRALLASTAG